MPTITDVQVIEETAGFRVDNTERGVTGTRVFLWADDETRDDQVSLPVIGDLFADEASGGTFYASIYGVDNLTCREVGVELVGGDKRRIRYTCNYKNEPTDQSAYETEEGSAMDAMSLPSYYEVGGEFQELGSSVGWQWQKTSTPLDQSVPVKLVNGTLRVKRVVKDDIVGFFDLSSTYEGSINANDFYGKKPWMWMYEGFTGTSFTDYLGRKCLDAELIFTYRSVTGDDSGEPGHPSDGWPYVFNVSTGEWDVPVTVADGVIVYDQYDLNDLFKPTT